MKIILLTDIKKLGKKDEIKEVKDGYANFLIADKKAVSCSNRSVQILENQIEKRKEVEDETIKECNDIKIKLEKTNLKFKLKTGANDKAFGSISTKNISDALKEKGFDIDKKKIKTKLDINSLGFYEVNINLHKKVIANIRIEVIKE
jgi:large subunit ribosomal protein L9